MTRQLLRLAGRTVDGRDAFGGVYRMYESKGVPLEAIFAAVREAGGVVAIDTFLQEAEQAGMARSRALGMLQEPVVDVLGREAWAAIQGRYGSAA